MLATIGPAGARIILTATPGDIVRSLIGQATKAHGPAAGADLVVRAAAAIGGTSTDIEALQGNSAEHLRQFLDNDLVTRLAGAIGTSPVALSYRSTMGMEEEDEEGRAVAGGALDEDDDGAPDTETPEPSADQPVYRFLMSDAHPDRADDIVSQGWDLSEFVANPVAPYNHNYYDLPVGRWRNVGVGAGNALRGTLIPTPSEHYPLSMAVADMLASRTLRTVSVGFRPRSVIPRASLPEDDPLYAESGMVFVGPRLMECSVTPMPMNPRAAMRAASPAPVARSWAPFTRSDKPKPWAPFWG